MRTPAGTECRFYYADFNRGRQLQECRLIQANAESLAWSEAVCARCKVPAVLRANGSPDLQLRLTRRKRFGLLDTLDLEAHCRKHGSRIADPYTGCPECAAELRDVLGIGDPP